MNAMIRMNKYNEYNCYSIYEHMNYTYTTFCTSNLLNNIIPCAARVPHKVLI